MRLVLSFFILIFVTVFFYGIIYSYENWTFNDFDKLVSSLQNMSAMIFAVSGIWLASVYPEALKKWFKPQNIDGKVAERDESKVSLLVAIIVATAVSIVLLFIALMVKVLLIETPIYQLNKDFFKISFSIWLFSICIIQLTCFYFMIISSINFLISLRLSRKKREAEKEIIG